MADSGLSKAAKKNAKRRAAKKKGAVSIPGAGRDSDELSLHDMLGRLQEELDKAKAEKDHDRAGKLRDQIWVLTDVIKGVRTDLPDDELLPILQSISMNQPEKESKPDPPPSATASLTVHEKKIRALRKKLQQIDALKEKQRKGETLEKTQLDKLQAEDKIKDEIDELEDLMEEALSLS